MYQIIDRPQCSTVHCNCWVSFKTDELISVYKDRDGIYQPLTMDNCDAYQKWYARDTICKCFECWEVIIIKTDWINEECKKVDWEYRWVTKETLISFSDWWITEGQLHLFFSK